MIRTPKMTMRLMLIAVLVVVGLVIVFSSYTVIGPGHRGVVVMLGKVEDTVLGEGFHLVLPPVLRQVLAVDVRTKKLEVVTEAASSDLQAMMVTAVLNYHLEPMRVGNLYQEVGLAYEDIIIAPALQEAIKGATAGYRVERILAERAGLREAIKEDLSGRLQVYHISTDELSLANIEFSQEFNSAIERKQVAEQGALQKQYELQAAQKDVEITLALAEGDKKAAVIAAGGRAEARKIEAQAEAEALRLVAEQLRGNPDLIRYEWAVRLSPSVSTVLLPADQAIILDSKSLLEK